jgi:hypothetical protein
VTRLTRAIVFAASLTSLGACDRRPSSDSPTRPDLKSSAAPSPSPAPSAPRVLLELPSSPYAAALVLDGSAPALLTADALHGLGGGAEAPRTFGKGELGVLVGGDVVRWMDGELRRQPRGGGTWLGLARPSSPPRQLAAGGAELAWLQGDGDSSASIWTLRGAEPRRLAAAPGGVATLTLHDDQVFFVEVLGASSWRLGAVSVLGGPARYASPVAGRTPALLAVTSDLFYYDGPTLSVNRVSTDLRRTERVGSDVVCSPLAVAEAIYCVQPGGILALPLSGGAPRVVVSTRGMVTAITATRSELTWLREAPGGGLAVEALTL